MKTIKSSDIAEIPASEVKPGHILIEGLVLEVNQQGDAYFFSTGASGTTVYAEKLQVVQVLAQVTESMVEAARESYKKVNA